MFQGLLGDQLEHVLGQLGQLFLTVKSAAPRDPDELDQIDAALSRLNATNKALFPPNPLSQLPLGQSGLQKQGRQRGNLPGVETGSVRW